MDRRAGYQFEFEDRVDCVFIGAGGHTYRNIYPALQYAPVRLRAVCDLDGERAQKYARMFGAASSGTDYRRVLEREKPSAAFVVTDYDGTTGRVQATDIAKDCLDAGVHVWMEKPTAASTGEVRELMAAAKRSGCMVVTGLKKIFAPAMEKLGSVVGAPEFGGLSSLTVRYPQALPPFDQRADLQAMGGFLDHLYHPAAILGYLGGAIERMSDEWNERTGASVTSLQFASGAAGTLHLSAGAAQTSPLERVEAVGVDANAVLENGVRLRYYRPGARREYGRAGSFLDDEAVAPVVWEPEFSLGQLYNKNLFYLGYVPEVLAFSESVLSGTPPEKGTLRDALAIMELFEAYQQVPPGVVATLPVGGTATKERG